MLEKQHQSIAFELIQSSKLDEKQILYFCESDKEARLLKNELLILLDNSMIGYYPEREILPYDRFSTADSIIQDRLKLLNSDKRNLKIVVTSGLNLFEKLPSKNDFLAKKQFKLGDSLSIKDLTAILEDMNYQRVDKVTSINEYTVRGGVVDFYSGFDKQPLRVDFFGDQIDEIRQFDPSSQHMIDKLSNFKLFSGSEIRLNDESIKKFKSNWRDYFQTHDERHCEIFQTLVNGKYPEGYEIYNPLIQTGNSNLIDFFPDFSLIKSNKIDQVLLSHMSFVEERYQEESIDVSRPLMRPEDYVYQIQEIQSYIDSSKQIAFASDNTLIDNNKR